MNTNTHDFMKYATHDRGPFFEIAFKYSTKEGAVLDIGAGAGEFADMLGRRDIYLLEGNPESAMSLRRRYSNVYEISLPASFPFADGFFSLIHSSHLVEHLHPHDLYALLKEMDRCLAPGGHLVISAPLMWEGFYHDLSHIRPYPPAIFKNYLCNPEYSKNRTRTGISESYKVMDTVYRHHAKLFPILTSVNGPGWKQRALQSLSRWLRSRGAALYEQTGYTVVLQKNT